MPIKDNCYSSKMMNKKNAIPEFLLGICMPVIIPNNIEKNITFELKTNNSAFLALMGQLFNTKTTNLVETKENMTVEYRILYLRIQNDIIRNFGSTKYHDAPEIVYSPENERLFKEGEIFREDKLSTKMNDSMLVFQNEELSSEIVDQVDSIKSSTTNAKDMNKRRKEGIENLLKESIPMIIAHNGYSATLIVINIVNNKTSNTKKIDKYVTAYNKGSKTPTINISSKDMNSNSTKALVNTKVSNTPSLASNKDKEDGPEMYVTGDNDQFCSVKCHERESEDMNSNSTKAPDNIKVSNTPSLASNKDMEDGPEMYVTGDNDQRSSVKCHGRESDDISSDDINSNSTKAPVKTKVSSTHSLASSKDGEHGPDKYVTDDNDQRSSVKCHGRESDDISSDDINSNSTKAPVKTKVSSTPSLASSKDGEHGPDKYVTDDSDQRSSVKYHGRESDDISSDDINSNSTKASDNTKVSSTPSLASSKEGEGGPDKNVTDDNDQHSPVKCYERESDDISSENINSNSTKASDNTKVSSTPSLASSKEGDGGPDKNVSDDNDQPSPVKCHDISFDEINSNRTKSPDNTKVSNTPSLASSNEGEDGPGKYVTGDNDQRASIKRPKFASSNLVVNTLMYGEPNVANVLLLVVVVTMFSGCSGYSLQHMDLRMTNNVSYNIPANTVTLTWCYNSFDVEIERVLSASERMIAKWNTNGDLNQTSSDERMRFNRSVSNGIECISLTISNPRLFELFNETYYITIVFSSNDSFTASAVIGEKLTAPTTKMTDTTGTPTTNTRIDIVPTLVLSFVIVVLLGVPIFVGIRYLRRKQRRKRSGQDFTDETLISQP